MEERGQIKLQTFDGDESLQDSIAELRARFNPSSWHKMLSRRSWLKKFLYWVNRPLGATIRGLEIATFRAPLLSRLFTDSSLVNMGITFEKILTNLALNTTVLKNQDSSERTFLILKDIKVDLKNGFLELHSGHFFSPYKSDRQFMSGMFIDDLKSLTHKKLQQKQCFEELYFILPKQDFYYHYLIEFLPRIIELQSCKVSFKVLSTTNQPSFVFQTLKELDVPLSLSDSNIVFAGKVILAEETSRLSIEKTVHYLRSRLLPGAQESRRNPKRLILTRTNQPRYSEEYEKVLIDYLVGRGFTPIDPLDYSILEQINLFKDAKVLVGFHGGGFSNMVFMPMGSQIIEIYAKGYDGYNPSFFDSLARACNHHYTPLTKKNSETMDSVLRALPVL